MKLIVVLLVFLKLPALVSAECKPQQNDKYRTSVEYNGNLTCTLRPTFCAMTYYIEWDRIAKNENLHFIRLHCTKTGILSHHAYVYFIGGDGWNDEPRIEVYHDCTKNRIKHVEIDLEPVSVYKNSAKLDYSFNITNRGVYDLFSKTHQNRYKDIPGEDNPFVADWLAFDYEKAHKQEGIFEKYDEPEEGCLKTLFFFYVSLSSESNRFLNFCFFKIKLHDCFWCLFEH